METKEKINTRYYNWDISQGDYFRDFDTTSTYEKLLRRKKLRKKVLKLAGLSILVITIFVIFLF